MAEIEYIDLKYQPSNNDLICSFYVEPDNCSLEKAAKNIALESSIGTWTEIEIDKDTKKLKPSVFYINSELYRAPGKPIWAGGNHGPN